MQYVAVIATTLFGNSFASTGPDGCRAGSPAQCAKRRWQTSCDFQRPVVLSPLCSAMTPRVRLHTTGIGRPQPALRASPTKAYSAAAGDGTGWLCEALLSRLAPVKLAQFAIDCGLVRALRID